MTRFIVGGVKTKKTKKTNLYKAAGCPLHNRPTHLRFKVMKNIMLMTKMMIMTMMVMIWKTPTGCLQ